MISQKIDINFKISKKIIDDYKSLYYFYNDGKCSRKVPVAGVFDYNMINNRLNFIHKSGKLANILINIEV